MTNPCCYNCCHARVVPGGDKWRCRQGLMRVNRGRTHKLWTWTNGCQSLALALCRPRECQGFKSMGNLVGKP